MNVKILVTEMETETETEMEMEMEMETKQKMERKGYRIKPVIRIEKLEKINLYFVSN